MKIRNIPFGYKYQNGEITVHPQELSTLQRIFRCYLDGQSLLQISKLLNSENVEYMPNTTGWNKARLMRMIDDTRYLGKDAYPAVIDSETYEQMQRLKESRNTQKQTDRSADIYQLKIPVLCPSCGSAMRRRHDKRVKCKERWICQNRECKAIVEIEDGDLLRNITDRLNQLIESPSLIRIDTADPEPSNQVTRLNNEINRTLNSFGFDKTALREKLFKCITEKYAQIDDAPYISRRLKADFEKSSPLSSFSADLCTRTVKSIRLGTDGTVSITLINGQNIGKEQAV